MYADPQMSNLGLAKDELVYITGVETMIKEGTNPIVRSLSITRLVFPKK